MEIRGWVELQIEEEVGCAIRSGRSGGWVELEVEEEVGCAIRSGRSGVGGSLKWW